MGTHHCKFLGCHSVLGAGRLMQRFLSAGFAFNHGKVFQYESVSWASRNRLAPGSQLVNLAGGVPCCIASSVPYQAGPGANASQISIGDVLGICNLTTGTASITWLGEVYPQDENLARLLTARIYNKPGMTFYLC